MSLIKRLFSKINRVATEQVAGSTLSGWVAGKIKGNYILMYHGVSATSSTRFNTRHASILCFNKQIQFLKKHAAIISLQDFFEGRFIGGKPNFALTFDDGYLNNYTLAKPVLETYQCPATFFITGLNKINDPILWADYVNIASVLHSSDIQIAGEEFTKRGNIYYSRTSGKSLYEIIKHQNADYAYKQQVRQAFSSQINFFDDADIKDYWQLMSDEQIKAIAQSKYIRIGSHGFYHNNLGTIGHNEAEEELQQSKSYLENLCQYEINDLAYPDGSYTLQLVQSAAALGFKRQLAIDNFLFNDTEDTLLIKKRNGIYTVDTCLNQLFTAIKVL